MSILLSHTTALEALRRWDLRKRLARGQRCAAVVPSRVDEGDAPFATGSLLDGLTKPLHALVSDRRAALKTPTIHAHLQSGPLPDESAISLSEGVLCCSPEHVVVQLAPHLTVIELAYLLSELMGTYAVNDAMEDGMFQRDEPLTTPDRILRHLGKLGRCAGTGMVRRALALACVRSGSPRETKLAMRLGLRPGLGGYNLNVLSLNEPTEVRRICDGMSKGVRRPDILIASPDGRLVAALEYLGSKHDEHVRLVQDANRTNELKAMGVSEYQIRKEHYDDLDYMDGLVRIIRDELGYPRIGMTRATARKRREARDELRKELDAIDGITWDGLKRARLREGAAEKDDEADWAYEEVPIEVYGLD